MLCKLAGHPGRVYSREILLEAVWGYPQIGDGKLVDTHIYRLRSKLEDDPTDPQVVVTVRGLGYNIANDRPTS